MNSFHFVVKSTFRLPSRPYVLAVGTLEGGPIETNDQFELVTPEGSQFSGTVVQIEIHNMPGEHTIGIVGPAAEHVREGAVITSKAALCG